MRWWWPASAVDAAEITRELELLAAAGIPAQQWVTGTRDSGQRQDEEFAKLYADWTGEPRFGSPLVDHLPLADGVPTPKDVLGYHIGAPAKLTYYADILNETKLMMSEADPQTDAAYHGLAKFLSAWTWATTTDMWGPIPFTEALKPEVPSPPYDDQQVVYDAVDTQFEEAIAMALFASKRIDERRAIQ